MVLLLGQYSVGKTSFIEYMLKRQFPGMRIGPEPTTDRFVAVMHDKEDKVIPGNALSVDSDRPFHGLNAFGNGFLTKFEGSLCNADILEKITFIDTPGILSGEKQRIGRTYDFERVTEWFVQRSDLVLLLFDAHKLDISDEFKSAIELLKGNEDKVRVVLNKADGITVQQLMRVYGALMWSLGKVVRSPEVMRVYLGSFSDEPYKNEEFKKLFEAEQRDLLFDLLQLPRNSAVRKINELVKRARLLRAHMHIITHIRAKMPWLFGKEDTQKEIIQNLATHYREIEITKQIPKGDFPDIAIMQQRLSYYPDFTQFPQDSERLREVLDKVLTVDLPSLMKIIQPPKAKDEANKNPFTQIPWDITPSDKFSYDQIFQALEPKNGKIPGKSAQKALMDTGLDLSTLSKIWELSDMEKRGQLDSDEFAVALYLTELVKKGNSLPATLPFTLIPPSKRNKT